MKPITLILCTLTIFLIACSSAAEYICLNSIEGNLNKTTCCTDSNSNNQCDPDEESSFKAEPLTATPEQEAMLDCSKFFIEVNACRDDHTVKYTITGNAPFSYQFVGLGATPFQDMFEEANITHKGNIQTEQRLSTIVINPYLEGVMCKQASVQVMLEEC